MYSYDPLLEIVFVRTQNNPLVITREGFVSLSFMQEITAFDSQSRKGHCSGLFVCLVKQALLHIS